jgi:hypothetical protein
MMIGHKESGKVSELIGKDLIRYLIIAFWVFFWLFNVIDKVVGGAHFLFVGKDRFAQIQRLFDSLGLGAPVVANIALVVTVVLEVFAFVSFSGAIYHKVRKNPVGTHSWFFTGICLTLVTFTYFSIGDQAFGDHAELLEHNLFWFIALLTWVVFIHVDQVNIFDNLIVGRRQVITSVIFVVVISAITTISIGLHNSTAFIERTRAVEAVKVSDNQYKIQFPFLAGSQAFENSIAKFKADHPNESIIYIYTAPAALRLGESDGLIIYIQTSK